MMQLLGEKVFDIQLYRPSTGPVSGFQFYYHETDDYQVLEMPYAPMNQQRNREEEQTLSMVCCLRSDMDWIVC